MDRSKGPNYCITPNPYRNLMGEQVPLSVHPAVVATLDRIVTMDLDKIFATKDGVTTVPKLVLADDSDLTKVKISSGFEVNYSLEKKKLLERA